MTSPVFDSVMVRLVYDCNADPMAMDPAGGEWIWRDPDRERRPNGGFYKVTKPGRRRDEYEVWYKPSSDFVDRRKQVEFYRGFYRDEWCYVKVIVKASARVVADDGSLYYREAHSALWGVEYGETGDPEGTKGYIRELAHDLAMDCMGELGVAIPPQSLDDAVDAALDRGIEYP